MKKPLVIRATFLVVISVFLSQICNAQCMDCGTGSDSAFVATANTTLAGGTYNFTTFYIDSNVTVTVTDTLPLIIRCTGLIQIQGTLSASGGNGGNGVPLSAFGVGGTGVAGGANGGDGIYLGSGSPGSAGFGTGGGGGGNGWSGGGGAGYSINGNNSGGVGGFGGSAYGNALINPLVGGSGGGGGSGGNSCGSGGGGAGGGIIIISTCDAMYIGASGVIKSDGGNGGSDGTGGCGGGGGGSGGSIILTSDTLYNDGTISAVGGTGGASDNPGSPFFGTGANGAQGRIRFDYMSYTGGGTVTPPAGHIGQPLAIGITAVTNVTCHGDSNGMAAVMAGGGNPPYTYLWSPTLQSTQVALNLFAGMHIVTVTDSIGTFCTLSVPITEPTPIIMTVALGMVVCEGNCDTVVAAPSGGNGPPYTYLWTPDNITTPAAIVCPDSTTIYTCTVWDNMGCSSSAATTVTVNPLPVLTLTSQFDTVCANWTVNVLSGTPAGGTFFGLAVTGNIFNPSFAGTGIHDLYYAYTDSNGCSDTVMTLVLVDPCAGIESLIAEPFINVFPNPSHNIIHVHSPANIQRVEIVNVAGEIIHSSSVNSAETEINTSAFAEGIYLVRIKLEEGYINRSMVVKR